MKQPQPSNHFAQSRLLWTPPNPSRTRVDVLRRVINHKHGLQLKDYHDLHTYSVQDYAFWLDLWEFLGITSSVPPSTAHIIGPGRAPHLPTWFPGARLNHAENLLGRSTLTAGDDGIALSVASEGECITSKVRHVSWRELRKMVEEAGKALKEADVQVGDRVALILTNSPTAIALGLGVAAVGGILSPTAPDMGAPGVLDRYRQIRPRMLIVERSYRYGGKRIDLMERWKRVVDELRKFGLEQVVVVPGVGDKDADEGELPLSVSYKTFLARGAKQPGPLTFEQLPFDHPLYILYSSGTSGPPKCIVHSAGGSLLQNVKAASISFGMSNDDTYFQFTTIGWVMWPFMLAALGSGARVVTYDGSPFYPDVREFLKFISEQRVSIWGTSPRFLMEVQKLGLNPLELAPFDSLRTIFVTGAVFTPSQFEWAQRAFGPRVQIASGSGGTDICGGFVGQVETLPVYAGEIQGKALGMKIEIFDDAGNSIEDTGEPGELVCTRPHPTLPLCFWGDESGEMLHKAYFDMYPGVWRQGDFMVKNPRTNGFMVLGRSDGVLNPSGVRFGSAEIYAVLDSPPSPFDFSHAIMDTLCVGQRRPGRDADERVFLFLKMRDGHKLTGDLKKEIRDAIRAALSARHVPQFVFDVKDIPYTTNSKKIELAVKRIVSEGITPTLSPTVANPDAFNEYFKFFKVEKLTGGKEEEGSVKAKSKL